LTESNYNYDKNKPSKETLEESNKKNNMSCVWFPNGTVLHEISQGRKSMKLKIDMPVCYAMTKPQSIWDLNCTCRYATY